MKKILALTICFMFAGAGSIFAEVNLQKYTWELGTEISHIKYEEPGVMEEEGMMYGIVGSYTYRGWLSPAPSEINKCMLKIEGKWSYGQVDYDGALADGTPYTMDNIDDYMLEFRALGGYDCPVLKASILTPYIGFGYRYLNDDSSSDPAGYERESNYFYSPIGIETLTELESGWSIGVAAEYDYFWKGIQKSHLSDVSLLYPDIENDQNDGYGLRGSIKLQKESEKVDYVIESFIRYWDIDKSDVDLGYIEPENNSTEIGINFAMKF